ncbi:MAG: 4-(cytidine 5'-diphospho)-2-C-methyl-D-erythritol kinase [Acutalibacteraceae bacterium]|nr:4-(cytidine 5'-diphospho)-2-C-methyl-D-erythritol kinase [Acutalibacteraceae bacterium]
MVKVLAPAKINFTLDITGKLDNGYHTVDMVMQSVDLYDVVTVEKNTAEINLTCDKDFVPCNSSNTAYKAVQLFSEHCNIDCTVDIHIQKNIPAQAGMAGGSTDGAAVLVALNELYQTNLTIDELAMIGSKIGADVPFCFYGGTMLATGIGTTLEKIEHNLQLNNYYILLCKPYVNVSTPLAYKKSDERPFSSVVHSKAVIKAMQNNDINGFCSQLYNDFDSLLMIDEVQHIKAVMKENGALASVMSGSGPTVYGVYSTEEQAENTAELLKSEYSDVFVAKTCDNGCKII